MPLPQQQLALVPVELGREPAQPCPFNFPVNGHLTALLKNKKLVLGGLFNQTGWGRVCFWGKRF
jgi:hypothetical protein